MNLSKLFEAVDEQQQDNKKMAENLENRTARFLKLIGKAYCFQCSPYSLTADEIEELAKQKDFMVRTEQDLKKAAGVAELVYIYEAVLGEGSGEPDTFNPDRGKIGSYNVEIPVAFCGEVRQIIAARAAEAKKPVEPTVYSKEEKLDFGLQAFCDGSTEAAAAKTADVSLISFRAALSKFSRNRDKMETMLGPRFRNRAEGLGILVATPGRQKQIEGIADGRISGKTVVELSKEYKLPLGCITSALAHVRSLGDQFLYNRYFPKFGESWRSRCEIAFENKHYSPGMRAEFLEAGGSEKEYNKQQTAFNFPDGYLLA